MYHKQRFNQRGQLWDMRLSTLPFNTHPADGDRGSIVNYYSKYTDNIPDNYVQGGSGTDNNGNLLRQETYIPGSSFFQQTYDYDSLNRLKWVAEKLNGTGNDTFKQAYLYDRWGNRRIDQGNTTANVPHPQYTMDPANNNRMLAPAGYTHQYDAAGNQTRDTFTLNTPTGGYRTFDAENRIIAAQKPSKGVSWAYYTYNGDGLRVRRNVASYEIWQAYGMEGELLAEYPQIGSSAAVSQPQKEYGYRNGQLLVTAEPLTNIAWNKPATQMDDNAPSTTANKAVDGDVNGALWDGHASATNNHTNSWWQVDLQSVQTISSITVWGRTDCCPDMTSNFYVFVSDNPFTSYDLNTTLNQAGVSSYYYANYANPQSVSVNRTGRYVRVQLAGTNYLVLGEVQVWGAAAKLEWMVTDHLGTPRIIADKTGSTTGISRHDYLPFGEELFAGTGGRTTGQGYTSSDGVRQQFTQKERDIETGLDYFLARYFSSIQGRFISPDEFSGGPQELFAFADSASANPTFYSDLTNPQSLNKYQYAYNNPLRYVDPNGHDVLGYELIISGPNNIPDPDNREQVSNPHTLGPQESAQGGFFGLNLKVNFDKGDNIKDYQHVRAAIILNTNEDIRNDGIENPGGGAQKVVGQSRFVDDRPGASTSPKAGLAGKSFLTILAAGEYNKKSGTLSSNVAYYAVAVSFGKNGALDKAKSTAVRITRDQFIALMKQYKVRVPKNKTKAECPECLLSPPGDDRPSR